MDRTTRAVFFDAGYTLLCMEPDQKTNFLQSCADLGIEIDLSRLDDGIKNASTLLAPHTPVASKEPFSLAAVDRFWIEYHRVLLAACAVNPDDARRADAVYRRFTDAMRWRVYDEVRPLLDSLRSQGMKLGVISNWTGDLEIVLESVALHSAFDFVIDSAHYGYEKPHPEIFHEALRRAGVAAPHALHVGDSPGHDVEGALAAGLRAALLDREDAHPKYSRAPRLTSLDALPTLL